MSAISYYALTGLGLTQSYLRSGQRGGESDDEFLARMRAAQEAARRLPAGNSAADVVAEQEASTSQIRSVEERATGMTPPLEQRTTFIQQPSIAQRGQRVSPLAQSWQLPLQLQPPAFSIGRSSGPSKNLAFYGVAAAVGLAAIWLITRGE